MTVSDIKDSIQLLKKNTDTSGVLIRIACVMILFEGFLHYWNILKGTRFSYIPLLPKVLVDIFSSKLNMIMLIAIILLHYELWKKLCGMLLKLNLPDEEENSYMALFMAVIKCVSLGASLLITIFSFNSVIQYLNGIDYLYSKYGIIPYIIALICLIEPYFMHHYYEMLKIVRMHGKYTGCFDVENKEIYIGDRVIFHRKRCEVGEILDPTPNNPKHKKLIVLGHGEYFSTDLESALKDSEGNLTVIR